ncbi:DNA repair protein RecN [Henriciella mobilis]|uniref:DNA repair protein RecN n=1 Tax=Henriciella mobilis TaxID=2305467 RepID=A0A399RRY2_9PROT|nr:DNA repair protein RecN [Henriciella mobilis]RIJ32657.1 DNA repair protein RecN [Henriciella mobilis]
MIIALSIRSFLLIERLDIEAAGGFTALTGETGAGKSIILDALGLALGAAGNRKFVRKDADQASILVEFCLPPDHEAWALLSERGVEASPFETLTLKRVIPADGPARAFVNDQPVNAGLLGELGESLVEIHGQHSASGLMKTARHGDLLDTYAGNETLLQACRESWKAYQAARSARERIETDLKEAEARHAWLAETLETLEALAPEAGEVEALVSERSILMQSEKIAAAAGEAVEAFDGSDVEAALARASRASERILSFEGLAESDGALARAARSAADALERALIEAGEARAALDALSVEAEHDPDRLEKADQRLHALKGAARKFGVEPDGLPALLDDVAAKIALSDAPQGAIDKARSEEKAAAARWRTAADRLSEARRTAAGRLESAIEDELKPLKLERTRVQVRFDPVGEDASGLNGREKVEFEVETNPGAGFGPLRQIASGGELARFSLALQCALAETTNVPVMVFDEADQGVGGAVAAAIGERLSRLAGNRQVFAITHSPQVAAAASGQWLVSKTGAAANGLGETLLKGLDQHERHEEIARMLSGATVTEEARAAATRLLEDV